MLNKQGKRIESRASVAERTAKSFHVRTRNSIHEEFVRVSEDFPTEDAAVQYCRDNELDNKYISVRIYSDKGMHVSGW